MQVDDIADQHDDLDNDSLFGSPPPSPQRGRSPSPLALPGGQSTVQNVGTLALPGSHLFSELSELPSAPPPAPTSLPQVQRLQRPVAASQLPALSRSATPVPRTTLVARKPKRASRRSTPALEARPTPPPIMLPSPTDPPPQNFLRNQQALLGVAGLVGGVNPATLSVQRRTRGESPSNPIVVEDEKESPMIGRRPVHNAVLASRRLPTPSTHEILSSLVKQKNLYPILDALLRLVSQSSHSATPTPPAAPLQTSPSSATAGPSQPPSATPTYQYPFYPYQYAHPYYFSYPYAYSAPYHSTGWSSTASSSSTAAYQAKRRKLSNVPAGAADWDVPYPFEPGQEPMGYYSFWEKHRQQQLLKDLVGLIKSAANKAAAKKACELKDEPDSKATIGSVEYYRDRVLRYYRPQTGTNRLSDTQVPQTPTSATSAFTHTESPAPTAFTNTVTSTSVPIHDIAAAPYCNDTAMANIPPAPVSPVAQPTLATDNETVVSQLSSTNLAVHALGNLDTQNLDPTNLDELLALFNDIPAGELDALFASPDFSALCTPSEPATPTTTFDIGTFPVAPVNVEQLSNGSSTRNISSGADALSSVDSSIFSMDPSLLAIDPALLAISFPLVGTDPQVLQTLQASAEGTALSIPAPTPSSTSGTGAPPTPTLACSPVSLSDMDPPTPSWEFNFPEPEIASADGDSNSQHKVVGQLGRTDSGAVYESPGAGQDKGKGKAREVDDLMDLDLDVIDNTPVTSVLAAPGDGTSPRSPPSHELRNEVRTTPVATSLVVPSRALLPPYGPPNAMAHCLSLYYTGTSSWPAPQARPTPPSFQAKNREEIIRRARAMRAQIAEEIERAKVELWETSMEGGCLAVLAKEREKLGSQK